MRPDVDIRVFTILRSPTKLIGSTAVYFDPNTRCARLSLPHKRLVLEPSVAMSVRADMQA
jgi:hypothetical protein